MHESTTGGQHARPPTTQTPPSVTAYREEPAVISDRTANILVAVVTSVWVLNMIGGMFSIGDYQPSESINGIFTGTVGVAFLIRARSKGNEGD